VIGREFSYELLRAVSPMNDDELQAALTKRGGRIDLRARDSARRKLPVQACARAGCRL
jgi:hypothetical protein